MKKIIKLILAIILSVIYYVIWALILFLAYLAKINGLFSVYTDLFGNGIIYIGYTFAFVIIILPIILLIAKKKYYKIFIFSFLCTILFSVVAVASFFVIGSYYSDFTVDKWKMYPNERYIMFNDLIENHNIIGLSKNETEKLLGTPDEISKEGSSYHYRYGVYGNIEVVFLNEIVKKVLLH